MPIAKLLTFTERVLLFAGAAFISAMLLLVLSDVFARNAFGQPIRGVAEYLTQSLYLVVFLGLAEAYKRGAFIRSELVFRAEWGRRWQKHIDGFGVLTSAAVLALISYLSYQGLVISYTEARKVGLPGYFTLPEWPLRLITFLGAFTATVRVLLLGLIGAGEKAKGSQR